MKGHAASTLGLALLKLANKPAPRKPTAAERARRKARRRMARLTRRRNRR